MERDRAIIEHAADAFFVYDARGSIFDINRRACETLGYRRKEFLSLCMTDVEAILLPEGIGDEREVSLVAERIKKKFEAPFKAGRRELSVTASIGVAVGTRGGPRELLRSADVAMYRAKESSKNRHEVYDTGAPVRRDGRSRGHVRA